MTKACATRCAPRLRSSAGSYALAGYAYLSATSICAVSMLRKLAAGGDSPVPGWSQSQHSLSGGQNPGEAADRRWMRGRWLVRRANSSSHQAIKGRGTGRGRI